jgi:D-alanine-D-alanine ligase
MNNKKLKVVVLYGGKSGEHEVSLRSAASVFHRLDRERYEVIPVAIDQTGRWLAQDSQIVARAKDSLPIDLTAPQVVLLSGAEKGSSRLHALSGSLPKSFSLNGEVDVVFPVVHGTLCEDGTLQGLLESAEVAYVGCGVLASAVGMDKEFAKRLLRDAGVPVVPYLCFKKSQWLQAQADWSARVGAQLGYPCFVKPANSGSSVGVHRVGSSAELAAAVNDALSYDHKVLIEKAVSAREVELSVLESLGGSQSPRVSIPGEVVPTHAFYSYEAKYLDDSGARLEIPAQLSPGQVVQAQDLARKTFQVLDCEGLARVDLFLDRVSGDFYVNEINTLPGFTSISMYPKLWEKSGVEYTDLLTSLVELALARRANQALLKRVRN